MNLHSRLCLCTSVCNPLVESLERLIFRNEGSSITHTSPSLGNHLWIHLPCFTRLPIVVIISHRPLCNEGEDNTDVSGLRSKYSWYQNLARQKLLTKVLVAHVLAMLARKMITRFGWNIWVCQIFAIQTRAKILAMTKKNGQSVQWAGGPCMRSAVSTETVDDLACRHTKCDH